MKRFGKLGKKAKFPVVFAVLVVLLFFLITGSLTNFLYSKFSPSGSDTSNVVKSEKGGNKLHSVLALLALVNTYSITGTVADSVTSNGISGVVINLSQGGSQIASTTTDSNGNYRLNNLYAGSYTVTAILPSGKKATTSLSQTTTIINVNNIVNFGMIGVFTVSGKIFLDSNKDGQFSPGESGYQGASVSIRGPFTTGSLGTINNPKAPSAKTVTDNNGNYIFNNIDEGTYIISIDYPYSYRGTSYNDLIIGLSDNTTYNKGVAPTTAHNFGITPSTLLGAGGACSSTNTMDIILVISHYGAGSNYGGMNDYDYLVSKLKIDFAKAAADTLVDLFAKNLSTARIGVVQYSESYNFPNNPDYSGLLVPLTTLDNATNVANIKNKINGIKVNGGDDSCGQCGVILANQELAAKTRPNSQKMVVFLADGLVNQTSASRVVVDGQTAGIYMFNDIRNGLNAQNIIYNSIAVGGFAGVYQNILQGLTFLNSGFYYNDPDQGTLGNISQELADAFVPTASINGFVFQDKNNNGLYDSPPDIPVPTPVTIELTGDKLPAPIDVQTDSNGNFSFPGLCTANYTITEKTGLPWHVTTGSDTYNINAHNGQSYSGFNYGLSYGYLVKGRVFNDVNKNKLFDQGELNYSGPVNITATGGKVTVNSDNTYSIDGLDPGSYIISADFSPGLLKGYQLIEPKPSSFAVTVGENNACSVANKSTGAACDSDGNITNLNFAVSDSWPWIQSYGLGTRFDDGINNPLPAITSCGGGSFAQGTNSGMSSPGIAFTGDTSVDYGQGSVSSTGRSAGGISYPEVYSSTNPIRTSATGLRSAAAKAGYTIIQLNSVAACSSPDQHCNLQGQSKGFYATSGDLMFDSSLNIASGNYVIVADGNITFGKDVNITVAQGATLIIASGKDMVVDQGIHPLANACPVPTGQLQGIFSAGGNFIIKGNNGDCSQLADTMLNIDGSLIINAARSGGALQNHRDLCGGNRSYPSLTVTARPDFVLNLPAFIPQQNVLMHEDTP